MTIPSIYTFNAGQACVAGSRILVQRPVLDEVLDPHPGDRRVDRVGDPTRSRDDDGAARLASSSTTRSSTTSRSVIKEADLVFGGRHGPELVPQLPDGHWVEPTLFITDDNSIQICQEEIFGPVAVVIPFDTEDEAVAISNDCRYGLASGVWTRDLGCAQRMIRDIRSGNVWVNSYMQIRSRASVRRDQGERLRPRQHPRVHLGEDRGDRDGPGCRPDRGSATRLELVACGVGGHEAHGQVQEGDADVVDRAEADPFGVRGDLDPVEPAGEGTEHHLDLLLGQIRSEAVVRPATAESHVRVRGPAARRSGTDRRTRGHRGSRTDTR